MAFDAALDEYQEREREAADRRADEADRRAVRPDAVRQESTFGELREGDYMTAESGPAARWVEIVKVEPRRKWSNERALDWVAVTFRTPEPLGVAYEDKWVIERERIAPVVIDATRRAA